MSPHILQFCISIWNKSPFCWFIKIINAIQRLSLIGKNIANISESYPIHGKIYKLIVLSAIIQQLFKVKLNISAGVAVCLI
jgi:hypothetical protein